MQRLALCIFALLLFSSLGFSQEEWGLERCVKYALDNNIQIKQSILTERQAELNFDQSKRNKLPNLNGSSNFQLSWGRNIDPITNVFESQTVGYNSYSLNTGAMIFNGKRIQNDVAKSELTLKESKIRTQQMGNDIVLNLVTVYLGAVYERERVTNAGSQLAISEAQLERVMKLIEAGSTAASDQYDFEAQLARDEQALIIAENNLNTSLLNLKQLLQLPPETDIQLERPELNIPDVNPDIYTFAEVYNSAVQSQPSIRADVLRQNIADLDIEIAKSQFYPSLSVGGSLSTTFATVAKQIDGFTTALLPQNGVFINGEPVLFQVENSVPTGTSKIPYFNQLEQNLGVGMGLQLNVPIYSRGQNKTNVALAKLNAENLKLVNEQNKQTLKTNVLRAVSEAQAGKRAHDAALATKSSLDIAFQNTERKFNIGSSNTYEMTEAKNRLDVAINDLLIAKYDYIFKLKVIDYYLGKPLNLN